MGAMFDAIFESVISRYQAGGYLPGDLVKFRAGYKSTDTYKNMSTEMKKEVDQLANSGLNIRVTKTGDMLSGASAGNNFKTTMTMVVTIAGDHGGGRYYGQVSVTPDMIDISEDQTNKVPDQFKRKDPVIIKPQPYKADPKNITRVTDKGNKKNTPTDIKLAGESTKLKGDMANLANLWESTTKN